MSPRIRSGMTVCIRADRDVPMSIVNEVKQVLRNAYALNISYAANAE